MLEIIKKLNWVDVLILVLALRVCYIAVTRGLRIEVFKVLGAIAAAYLSLHYYLALSAFIQGNAAQAIERDFFELVCFIFLAGAGYAALVIPRKVFVRPAKEGESSGIDMLGGIILGSVRAILLASIVLYALAISGVDYFKKSLIDSYSGTHIIRAAPAAYDHIWNNFISKVAPKQRYNQSVSDVQQDMQK